MSRSMRKLRDEIVPRPKHWVQYRGKTEAAGCRGRVEPKTGCLENYITGHR